jgi:ribonuclease-3
MATTMEAIVGAYFEDQARDFAALQRVVAALGLSWPE